MKDRTHQSSRSKPEATRRLSTIRSGKQVEAYILARDILRRIQRTSAQFSQGRAESA